VIRTMNKFIGLFLLCAVVNFSYAATTASPAMIAQFKKLPKAEQQKLMKQYGLTPADLNRRDPASSTAEFADLQSSDYDNAEGDWSNSEEKNSGKTKGSQRFGLTLFSGKQNKVDNSSVPVPDFYVLGAGDQLLVQIFGKQSSSETLTIERDGSIVLPELGPVIVAGLTFAEAKALISDKIKKQILGVDVAVSMGELKTITIFVAGEAKKPGSYNVPALSTITQALTRAGGISDIGSLREVSVKRSGATVVTFDIYDLLLKGDASRDLQLQSGDVVFVAPVKALAEVIGEVHRPAIYEVTPGESVAKLLTMAGGLKSGAYPQGSVLERVNSKNVRDLLNLDLTQASALNQAVKQGDVLRVGGTSTRVENAVTIAGAVVRPGHYAWRDGLRVNDLLTSLWSDLHISADLDYGLIIREQNVAGDLQVIQFNLGQAITEPMSADNLRLAARDLILVFHQENQSFERARLDQYFREKLAEAKQYRPESEINTATAAGAMTPAQKTEPALNYSALTDQAFLLLDEKQEREELSATSVKTEQSTEQNWLVMELQTMLNSLFTNPEFLAKTPHLSRQELLLPVLNKLKSKSSLETGPKLYSVTGEVKVPGDYPLPEQASVKKLIEAAGGLKDSAYLQRAELTRATQESVESDMQVTHFNIDLTKAVKDEQEFGLKSRDSLNIFSIPNWNIKRQFKIYGHVRFPGVYTIQQGETLASILSRAGGLKSTASAEGAVFTRQQTKEREEEQIRKLAQQLRADIASRSLTAEGSSISPQDSMLLIAEIEKTKPVGRLVVNLEGIMNGETEFDLMAEDGDELFVPAANTSIAVVGEVQHAASHRFKKGLSLQDYLDLSGGFRKRADQERVYVIRADGSVYIPAQKSWFAVKEEKLKPGDTIVVPLDTEFKDSLSVWTAVTQIFYQSAVALAAINSF
jgi:polysaccharide export outer membrane protein